MREDLDFFVMLPIEKGGFYLRSIELLYLKELSFNNCSQIKMLYVHGIDLNDNLEFECNKENLLISTIGKFIDELENEFCSKELLNINIDFKNGNQLYYNTGELSVFFQEADDLENFVISFLKLYNFKNTDLLDKLRGFENEYLYIYPESEFDFNRFKFLLDDRLTDEPPF